MALLDKLAATLADTRDLVGNEKGEAQHNLVADTQTRIKS